MSRRYWGEDIKTPSAGITGLKGIWRRTWIFRSLNVQSFLCCIEILLKANGIAYLSFKATVKNRSNRGTFLKDDRICKTWLLNNFCAIDNWSPNRGRPLITKQMVTVWTDFTVVSYLLVSGREFGEWGGWETQHSLPSGTMRGMGIKLSKMKHKLLL